MQYSVEQDENDNDGFKLLANSMLTYNQKAEMSKKRKKKMRTTAQNVEAKSNCAEETGERRKDGGDDDEIQRLRSIHRIFTWGPNIPDPISDFASLPLPDKFRANLNSFRQPTPVQMQAIPIGLQHRDHLITAPTGSGKTLAFALPLIVNALNNRKECSLNNQQQNRDDIRSLCAVVIEPTKILAKQTYENFLRFCDGLSLNCEYLRGAGIGEQCDILVATPNRLIFALEKLSENSERSAKLTVGLQWLILDECDRMFDRTEGEASFRVQLSKILRLCNGKETRRGFYSATFSYEVEEWCKENLNDVAMACIGPRNSANEMVKQELLFVGWEQAKVSAVRDIIRRGFDPPALLFLQSKDRAKQLFVELCEFCNEIPIGLISGELSEDECEVIVERFRSGKIWLLICTELLGRGVDFQEVNLVINFDLESDLPIIRPIATVIRQAGFPVPEYLLRLHKPSKSVHKENKKKLKRVAPHRKNLLPNWGGMKCKVLVDVKDGEIKIGKRRIAEERKKENGRREKGKGGRTEDGEREGEGRQCGLNCEYLRGAGIGEQCDILVATPNRLIFALEKLSENSERNAKLTVGLQWLILDECDRMFDRTEGEASFRVQLSKILRLCNGKETRRGFYSATFSYEVEEWCKENLNDVAMACIGPRNSANEMVKQELLFVGWEQAKVSAVRDIVRRGFDPPALLFLQSKDRAKQLFVELCEFCSEIPIGLISGELSEDECEVIVERFRAGKIWLLICTELLGRGVDFQEVNLVINFDLPTSIVSYIHRIGRTGRAGRIGRAITFFTESDLPIIRPIATVIRQAGFPVPEYLLRLHKPSKENKKKLKRVAPHRKNLLPNWGGMKCKVLVDVKDGEIKIGKRRIAEERKKENGRREKGKGGGRKTERGKAKADSAGQSLPKTGAPRKEAKRMGGERQKHRRKSTKISGEEKTMP
uniref:RNA helicase n=1 Tax=Globodera pallida TaxID=36090 RepID=A0A183BI23_GLOPA